MKYTGGCHCGKVRFEADMELKGLISCNCSVCAKRGSVLGFTPEKNFKLLSGESALSDYQFGAKTIHHMFCSVCGILPFGAAAMPDGTKMRAINIRCLDNVDLSTVEISPFDGKSL